MNKKFLFAGMIVFALIASLFTPSAALFDKLSTAQLAHHISSQPDSPRMTLISDTRSGDRTYKCGDISTDTTWVADTYVLTCTVNVLSGINLTIDPGAVIKAFTNNIYGPVFGFQVAGTLSAVGTTDQPIVFTSLFDDTHGGDTNGDGASTTPVAGDWTRIAIDAGGSATLDHVLIRYSGGYIWPQSQESIRNTGGTLNLHNSTIEFGSGSGVRSISEGVIDIQDSLIQNNGEYGLYFAAKGAVAPIIRTIPSHPTPVMRSTSLSPIRSPWMALK